MPLMDWSLLRAHLHAFRTRQLLRLRQSDSSLNVTSDMPGSDLLRDIKLYPQYAQGPVDPRWCLLWSHARSQKRICHLSLPVRAIVKNIHAPEKLTRQMNPSQKDKRFESNQ